MYLHLQDLKHNNFPKELRFYDDLFYQLFLDTDECFYTKDLNLYRRFYLLYQNSILLLSDQELEQYQNQINIPDNDIQNFIKYIMLRNVNLYLSQYCQHIALLWKYNKEKINNRIVKALIKGTSKQEVPQFYKNLNTEEITSKTYMDILISSDKVNRTYKMFSDIDQNINSLIVIYLNLLFKQYLQVDYSLQHIQNSLYTNMIRTYKVLMLLMKKNRKIKNIEITDINFNSILYVLFYYDPYIFNLYFDLK